MQDFVDIERQGFADPRKIGVGGGKRVWHPHLREYAFQGDGVLGFEFREFRFDGRRFCVAEQRPDLRAVERGEVLRDRDVGVRQNRGEGVFAAFVRFDESDGLVAVRDIPLFGAREKSDLRFGSVGFMKDAGPDLGLFGVRIRPFRVEGERVDENRHILARKVVEDLIDHPVGFVLHPKVDVPDRRIVKGRAVRAGAVNVGVLLQKFFFDGKVFAVAQPNRVGNRKFDGIALGESGEVSGEIVVEFLHRHFENALHLTFRFAFRAVCRHGERDEDRERGEQRILAVVRFAEKADGKIRRRRRFFVGDGFGAVGSCLRHDCRHQVGRGDFARTARKVKQKDEQKRECEEQGQNLFGFHSFSPFGRG